jgi:hypothetical protein
MNLHQSLAESLPDPTAPAWVEKLTFTTTGKTLHITADSRTISWLTNRHQHALKAWIKTEGFYAVSISKTQGRNQ